MQLLLCNFGFHDTRPPRILPDKGIEDVSHLPRPVSAVLMNCLRSAGTACLSCRSDLRNRESFVIWKPALALRPRSCRRPSRVGTGGTQVHARQTVEDNGQYPRAHCGG